MTIYWTHSHGFRAISFGARQHKLQAVLLERYERVLRRFVEGDLFDSIWIAHRQRNDHGGIVLALVDGQVETTVSFLGLKDSDRIATFRRGMQSWGNQPEQKDPWTVGMGEDQEIVTLTYRLDRNFDAVRLIVERALEILEGPRHDEVFVSAWRSQDGPTGKGIKVVWQSNVLNAVP